MSIQKKEFGSYLENRYPPLIKFEIIALMGLVNLIFYNILTSINATHHKYIPKEAEFNLEKIGHQRKFFNALYFLSY